jgi:hypothetical protein
VNEEGRSSASDEVRTPISEHVTEPEIANIPCDLVHDNVVEDDVDNMIDPQGHHAPGDYILDALEEEGIINPIVICNAPIALIKPARRTEIPAWLKDCVVYKHDVAKYISNEKFSSSLKSFIAFLD